MYRLHRSLERDEGDQCAMGSMGDERERTRRRGRRLVLGVSFAALAGVAGLVFATSLIYRGSAAEGPSITRYEFTTNVAGADASGTYYAFWRDGDTVWSCALVVEPNGSGTLKVEGFDADGSIDPDAVVAAEDDDRLVWTQDGTTVTLTSAEGEHTLPDGPDVFAIEGEAGERLLTPLDAHYPDAVFYEDFEQAISHMQSLV